MVEFNLSEKIWEVSDTIQFIVKKDVKEFIKLVRNDLHLNISTSPLINKIIDKHAGKKLC